MSGNNPCCTIPQFNTKYDCELHGGEWSGPEDAEDEIIEPNPVAVPLFDSVPVTFAVPAIVSVAPDGNVTVSPESDI